MPAVIVPLISRFQNNLDRLDHDPRQRPHGKGTDQHSYLA